MSIETGRQVLAQEAEAIRHLSERLDGRFEQAVDWIFSCKGKVIACGIGKSGHIARKTAGTLSSTGTPSHFMQAAEAVHGDLGTITRQDIVLMYTHSGETDELVTLFPSIRAIGARTILVTGRVDSSAGRQADLCLNTHVDDEACPHNLAPTTSTTVMLALSDALALSVMERRGFSREDFARFHPSGTLGKRLLLTVFDTMRAKDDCAVVGPEEPILDVLRSITRAGVGAACVVGADSRLIGLITEGDVRRHLVSSSEPLNALASEIMTKDAWTIGPDLLAFEALEMFQNLPKPVGEMPVVRDNELLGLVTLKDLLRSGIV